MGEELEKELGLGQELAEELESGQVEELQQGLG
jgi:hypothetical protein